MTDLICLPDVRTDARTVGGAQARAAIEPWEQLRQAVVTVLSRTKPSWFEIWRLFLGDEWYQTELAKHARSLLRGPGNSKEWVDDVRHEVMLILAAKLRKLPDLGLDSRALCEGFPKSIGIISRNQCRQALKRLRRIYRTRVRLPHEPPPQAIVSQEMVDQSLRISMAIDELAEPSRSVLRLYQLGYNLREIALKLQLNYSQVYRAFRRGTTAIRTDFAHPECLANRSSLGERRP